MRPQQWVKNLFVFAPLVFAHRLLETPLLARSLVVFAAFCVGSSAVYLLNDVRDREADRLHPAKRNRPIASGALGVSTALAASGALAIVALGIAFGINRPFGLVAAGYLALMAAYSLSIKHVVILDVLALACGFVLRAAGGAMAVEVVFSHWLLLLTLLGALFLALSKRRAELVALTNDAHSHRKSLADYSPYLLDQMIGVATASTLLAYAFYTISPDTAQRFGTDKLIFTVPFPLYGIFRYLYLVHQREGGGSPSDTLLEDRPVQVCVALWAASVVLIPYGPWR